MFRVSPRWIKIYSSVILISIISKFTGYLRDAVITSRFGATLITDAYVVALLIPEVLFNIFGNSLTSNFTPVYYEAQRSNNQRPFVSTLISLYLIWAAVIFFIGLGKTDLLITLFSSGFKGPTLELTKYLLKIFMINIFFITGTYICLVFLQAQGKFLVPSSIGVSFNLAIIISMFFTGKGNGLNILIIGTILGYVAQLIIQLPQAFAKGLQITGLRLIFSPEVRKFISLSLPVALLAILAQLNIAMDNYFASRLPEGSITTLNLAYRVLMGFYSLLITNTMMMVHPVLSKSIVQNNYDQCTVIVQKTANWLIIILFPLTFYLFYNANPIISLMFNRGAFTTTQCALTALVFQGYICGLFFYAFRDLMLRYYFAENNVLIPMLNGIVNSTFNFIYLWFLVPRLKLPGVSLATALSAVSSSIILYTWAKSKVTSFSRLGFAAIITKVILACVISIFMFGWSVPYIQIVFTGQSTVDQILRLGTGFVIFCIFYSIVFLILFRKKIFIFIAK